MHGLKNKKDKKIKDKKGTTNTNAFQKILNKTNRKSKQI